MAWFGTLIQTKAQLNVLYSFSIPLPKPKLVPRKSLKMTMNQGISKRPICPSCFKPTRTCLCSRILTPGIENSVSVTILQHALESKHPLNSARIARLGFKNFSVATVSDVNFEARFVIRLKKLEPKYESEYVRSGTNSLVFHQALEDVGATDSGIEDAETVKPEYTQEERDSSLIVAAGSSLRNDSLTLNEAVSDYFTDPTDEKYPITNVDEDNEGPAVTATIGKYGVINSLSHIWKPKSQSGKPSFDKILAHPKAAEALSKGFSVTKFQRKKLNGSTNLEEYEEFQLEVPLGSVLVFPSDKAVDISGLDAIGFEVKILIVLDGTWAKARRIYSENPWLRTLPHLKLEMSNMSLYREVRHQPGVGYLSTIESIVYALRAIGENHEGLDNLLDVFESMVGYQRRCKEERLSKCSASGSVRQFESE